MTACNILFPFFTFCTTFKERQSGRVGQQGYKGIKKSHLDLLISYYRLPCDSKPGSVVELMTDQL